MSIKVTVVVLTYNHERFIAKALESILNQEIDFKFQIIVADDGSQDETNNIVDDFTKRFPDSFSLIGEATNQGVRRNIFNCISEIKGEYIAILDGDDFWSDKEKLQIQVDFLDQNQDFNGVFHDAEIIHVDSAQEQLFNKKKYYSQSYVYKDEIHPTDLVSRSMILPSSSALLRSSVLGTVDKSLLVDNYSMLWKLTCFAIKRSKFHFINAPMSVYHNHSKGISKGDNDKYHLSHILFFEKLLQDDYYKYTRYDIYRAMVNEYKILLDSKVSNLNKRKLFWKYVKCEFQKIRHYRKDLVRK